MNQVRFYGLLILLLSLSIYSYLVELFQDFFHEILITQLTRSNTMKYNFNQYGPVLYACVLHVQYRSKISEPLNEFPTQSQRVGVLNLTR